jgi:hypothetical protein
MALCGQRALNPTAVLPLQLTHNILLRLPVDMRARCACVSVGWREAVADPALWRRLDLSEASGVTCRVTSVALRAAAARARGGLEALDVTGCTHVWRGALVTVAAANAASLTEVRSARRLCLRVPDLRALLAAAPALQLLEVSVYTTCNEARSLLLNEPPFQLCRLRSLHIQNDGFLERGEAFPAAELVAHPSLRELGLNWFDEAALVMGQLDAVVDTALALQLSRMGFHNCELSPAAVPALARLLGSSALTELDIACHQDEHAVVHSVLLDLPAAALLADALRANCTLQRLVISGVQLWHDVRAALTLLAALTGHASLRSLTCSKNEFDYVSHHNGPLYYAAHIELVGAALGALVAADAPALEELDVSCCSLSDEGIGPLCDALAHNTHLRTLTLAGNQLSAGFAGDRLLPAVRANTSLRELEVLDDGDESPEEGDDADESDDEEWSLEWEERELMREAYAHKSAAEQLVKAREAARLAVAAAAAGAACEREAAAAPARAHA